MNENEFPPTQRWARDILWLTVLCVPPVHGLRRQNQNRFAAPSNLFIFICRRSDNQSPNSPCRSDILVLMMHKSANLHLPRTSFHPSILSVRLWWVGVIGPFNLYDRPAHCFPLMCKRTYTLSSGPKDKSWILNSDHYKQEINKRTRRIKFYFLRPVFVGVSVELTPNYRQYLFLRGGGGKALWPNNTFVFRETSFWDDIDIIKDLHATITVQTTGCSDNLTRRRRRYSLESQMSPLNQHWIGSSSLQWHLILSNRIGNPCPSSV